ncbi:MAG: (2Fe-2S)-binding protein [Chloroflexi bacterium]|nr:(2Fe-2S)-binding protein [Chloroflexota bacterium]
MTRISTVVNGTPVDADLASERLLIDFLRYDLGLTGTKEGCSIGVCGVCSVLVDGQLVSACLALAVFADGAVVTTIEGLDEDERAQAIQAALIEHGGYQCGICTPGQVVAARALLADTLAPTEGDVREWMAGNLCRCTGYYPIVRSVLDAARSVLRGGKR